MLLGDPLVQLAVRVGLALLFASTAFHKARDLPHFRATLGAYRIMPDVLVGPAAAAVVPIEVLLAGALLLPATAVGGAIGVTALLAFYASAIGLNLLRGRRDIDCGCGGPDARQPLSGWLVVRNVGLGVLAMATLVPADARPLVWLDWLTLAGTVSALGVGWGAAHRLLAEWARMQPHLQTHAVPEGE